MKAHSEQQIKIDSCIDETYCSIFDDEKDDFQFKQVKDLVIDDKDILIESEVIFSSSHDMYRNCHFQNNASKKKKYLALTPHYLTEIKRDKTT